MSVFECRLIHKGFVKQNNILCFMQVGVLMGDQSPRGRTKLVIALDPNRGNGYTSYIQDVHPVKSQVTLYTHKGSPLWLWLFLSEGPGTRAARGIISITDQ